MIVVHSLVILIALVGIVGGMACMVNRKTDAWGRTGGLIILLISCASTSYAIYFIVALLK